MPPPLQVTLSYNQQAGLLVNGAAKVDLVNCEAIGNKMCALIVWGAGTQAVAQDCRFNTNVQVGARVRACECVFKQQQNEGTVSLRFLCGTPGVSACGGTGLLLRMPWVATVPLSTPTIPHTCSRVCPQAGMAVKDGGRCELTRCAVRGNKLPSEVAGAGSWLGTRQCVMDEKPVVARGGAVQELLPEGKGGKGGKK